MNLTEARKILGINESADPEEARKAFKDLAKKYHPDINKEPGAEEKFKRINEAYQVVDSGEASTREERQAEQGGFQGNIWGGGQGFNIQDILNNMGATTRPGNRKRIIAHDITLPQNLTFKEAVTGCQKEITYTHNVRCTSCQGSGQKPIDNGCLICKGSGREEIRNQYSTTIRPCSKCRGKVNFEPCTICKTEGYLSMNSTLSINIPPGATEGASLNLGPRGNYVGDIMGAEQNTRLVLSLHVMPQSDLILQEPTESVLRVVHHLDLSLTEALSGCFKTVPTIDGPKEITIPPLSKHKDEIALSRLGIGRKEPQIVILNVLYPTANIDDLLTILNQES